MVVQSNPAILKSPVSADYSLFADRGKRRARRQAVGPIGTPGSACIQTLDCDFIDILGNLRRGHPLQHDTHLFLPPLVIALPTRDGAQESRSDLRICRIQGQNLLLQERITTAIRGMEPDRIGIGEAAHQGTHLVRVVHRKCGMGHQLPYARQGVGSSG